jgi:hypothetical protein
MTQHRTPLRARTALPVVAILGLPLALGACNAHENDFAPPCPNLALLQDAADITRFDGTQPDASKLTYAGRIASIPAACSNDGKDRVKAELHIEALVRRGPAGQSDTTSLPYFIAVLEGDQILQEQDFTLPITFKPNAGTANVTGQDIQITVATTAQKSAAAYRIFVGFRLTPAELEYNRTHPSSF